MAIAIIRPDMKTQWGLKLDGGPGTEKRLFATVSVAIFRITSYNYIIETYILL